MCVTSVSADELFQVGSILNDSVGIFVYSREIPESDKDDSLQLCRLCQIKPLSPAQKEHVLFVIWQIKLSSNLASIPIITRDRHFVVNWIEGRHHRSCVVLCSMDVERPIDLDHFHGVPVATRALAAWLQVVQYVSCNRKVFLQVSNLVLIILSYWTKKGNFIEIWVNW